MKIDLVVNELLRWEAVGVDSCEQVFRVLWISQGRERIVLINVFEESALPINFDYQEIISNISAKSIRRIKSHPDIKSGDLVSVPLSQKEKIKRDEAWLAIKPLVTVETPKIYYSAVRGPLVKARAKEIGVTKKTIYKWLVRYWQGGQTKSALIPHYRNCGSRGKERFVNDPIGSAKRGRPSAITTVFSEEDGINITREISKKLSKGYRLFHLKQGMSVREAYKKTMRSYFYIAMKDIDGVEIPILTSATELPSINQFIYWGQKDLGAKISVKTRYGDNLFEIDHKPILQSSKNVFGPGSYYQIDATPADIDLVSSLDPTFVVGRPTLYLTSDVFSTLITGLSITFDGDGWLSAMSAFENATTGKVTFCKKFNVEIEDYEWPAHHLPSVLVADRGPFESHASDRIVSGLGVTINNNPPYTPNRKGLIEENLRLVTERVIHRLNGAINKRYQTYGRVENYPCLNIKDFTEIIIRFVLLYNHTKILSKLLMPKDVITDGVERTPLSVWEWGVKNRAGQLRTIERNLIRQSILPTKEVSCSQKGIYFQGFYYGSKTGERDGWFVRRPGFRWKRVKVLYDPRLVDRIFLLDGRNGLETCDLLPDHSAFLGCSWQEVKNYRERQSARDDLERTLRNQVEVTQYAAIEKIASDAVDRLPESAKKKGLTRKRRQGIAQNRNIEKSLQYSENQWDLYEEDAEVDGNFTGDRQQYRPPEKIDLFRQHRKKIRGKSKDEQ